MSHATQAKAPLTPRGRLGMARPIVNHDWLPARATERSRVTGEGVCQFSYPPRARGRNMRCR